MKHVKILLALMMIVLAAATVWAQSEEKAITGPIMTEQPMMVKIPEGRVQIIADKKGIVLSAGKNQVIIHQEGISIKAPEGLVIDSPNFRLDRSGNLTVRGGNVTINAYNINVKGSSDVAVEVGDMSIDARDMSVDCDSDLELEAGTFALSSRNDVQFEAPSVDWDSSGTPELTCDGLDLNLGSRSLDVQAGDMTFDARELTCDLDSDMDIRAGSGIELRSGSDFRISGSILDLDGSRVNLAGGGRPVAVQGAAVTGGATVLEGSPKVLVP